MKMRAKFLTLPSSDVMIINVEMALTEEYILDIDDED